MGIRFRHTCAESTAARGRRGTIRRAQAVKATFVLTTIVGLTLTHATVSTATPDDECTGLAGTEIPATAIGLPTTGGEVTGARLVAPSGTGTEAIGEHCLLDAAIHPVDKSAPDIEMRVAIPSDWNEKVYMLGGGGYDGTIPDLAEPLAFGSGNANTPPPLGRGYAVFASDSGHQADPDFEPTPSLDGSFGTNDEAVRNFAGDALKKTRDAAMYMIREQRPNTPVQESYFAGNSSGGREALAVAQRWPTDFDGVISTFPAWNAASTTMFFGHQARVMSRDGAFPNAKKQKALHEAVLQACDGNDGVRDRVISDEAGCDFDPATIRCPEGGDTGDTCLSDKQIAAVEELSQPVQWDYPVGSGETGYPGFPYLSGANMTTPVLGMGTEAPANPMPKNSGYGSQFWDQWVRHFVTRDPQFNSLKLDPLNPGKWQERISELTALQDVNDPDLRPFAKAGGKLILMHGTADELVSHRSTVDYFERMRETMGKRAVKESTRFYLIPGANHGPSEAEFMPAWDAVGALDQWVVEGKAPRHPVAQDTRPDADRSRPLCEYPKWPKYNGHGDAGDATNFHCHRG